MNKTKRFVFVLMPIFLAIVVATSPIATQLSSILSFSSEQPVRPYLKGGSGVVVSTITGTSPPASGDWIISDHTIVENETLIINGSILIQGGGTLEVRNSTLYMNLTSNGAYRIEVYTGGNLTVMNSIITAYNISNRYYIKIDNGAAFYMNNSEVSYSGYGWGMYSGICVYAENVVINNSRIHHNYIGVYLIDSNNTIIRGNNITDSSRYGVFLEDSNNTLITGNNITDSSENGVYLIDSNNTIIRGNNIINSTSNGIYANNAVNNTVEGNTLTNASYYTVFIYMSHDNRIIGNIMNNATYGLGISYSWNITVNGNTVFNNSQDNMRIDRSTNITIAQNVISNTSGYGIFLSYSNNTIMKSNKLMYNSYGVYLYKTNVTSISENTISFSTNGIYIIYLSQNNTITENTIFNQSYGIQLRGSNNNIISGNRISNSTYDAISVNFSSENNTISENTIFNNSRSGVNIYQSNNNTIEGNTIVNNTWNGIQLYKSNSTMILWNQLNNNDASGVTLNFVENVTIVLNNMTYCMYGVTIYNSPFVIIRWNNVSSNSWDGIYIHNTSNYTTIQENIITRNNRYGINLQDVLNIITRGNIIVLNGLDGVHIDHANNTVIAENIISNHTEYGIYMVEANNNTVMGNTISNNTKAGIYLTQSADIKVFLNNFTDNGAHATDDQANSFDNGIYGNYWDNYTGTDADNDLIGDTAYQIDSDSIDNYPLMIPVLILTENVYYLLANLTTPQDTIGVKAKIVYNVSNVEPVHVWYRLNSIMYYIETKYNSTTNTFDAEIPTTHVTNIGITILGIGVDNSPVIQDVSWSPRCPTSSQSVIISVNITDDFGVDTVILSFYNGTWYNVTMTFSGGAYTATIPSHPSNTTIIFKVSVNDTAGHWTVSSEYQVTFDDLPEIQDILWTPQNPLSSQSVTISANVTDDLGISTVILSYNNGTWYNVTMTSGGEVYTATIPAHSGGTIVTFKIYVSDTGGHWIVSDEYQVTFDDPPKIQNITWIPQHPLSNQSVTVSAAVVDDIGISTVILSYYDHAWHNVTMTLNGGVYTAIIPAHAENTTVIFKVYVEDNGGHWIVSNEYQVIFSSVSERPQGGFGGDTTMIVVAIIIVLIVAIGVMIFLKKRKRLS